MIFPIADDDSLPDGRPARYCVDWDRQLYFCTHWGMEYRVDERMDYWRKDLVVPEFPMDFYDWLPEQ